VKPDLEAESDGADVAGGMLDALESFNSKNGAAAHERVSKAGLSCDSMHSGSGNQCRLHVYLSCVKLSGVDYKLMP
jgi:hypothetical protein